MIHETPVVRFLGAASPDDARDPDMDAVRACEAYRADLEPTQVQALDAGQVERCTEGFAFPDGSIFATRDVATSGRPVAVLA